MKTTHPTVFNDAQLYLLDVFSDIKTDKELLEIDQKRLDEINELDLHSWLEEQC